MMKIISVLRFIPLFLIAGLLLRAPMALAHETGLASGSQRVSQIFAEQIPNIPGKSLKVVLVEYGSEGATPAHLHAPSAYIFGYVLEGEIESQVNDGAITRYKAGESFSEHPGDVHVVSRNPSKEATAKLLAVFVVDTDDETLTTLK